MEQTYELKHVSPVSLGAVLAALYGGLSLLAVVPLGCMAMTFSNAFDSQFGPSPVPSIFGGIGLLFLPFLYAILGFVSGVAVAAFYNWIVRLVGGVKVRFSTEEVSRLVDL